MRRYAAITRWATMDKVPGMRGAGSAGPRGGAVRVAGRGDTEAGRNGVTGQARIGVLAALVVALLGFPVGWLWTAIAPRTTYVVAAGKAYLGNPEGQTLIAADGWFAVLAVAAGVCCAVAAYLLAGRFGEFGLLTAVAVGGTAASLLAWRIGHMVGLSAYQHLLRTGRDGVAVRAPLDLHAVGVILLWPLAAVVAFGLLEALDVAGRGR